MEGLAGRIMLTKPELICGGILIAYVTVGIAQGMRFLIGSAISDYRLRRKESRSRKEKETAGGPGKQRSDGRQI